MARTKPKGSGKPKGYKAPKTLEKLAAREFVRQKVTRELGALIDAQVANAKGVKHFVLRTKAGKFERVTDPDAIIKAMNAKGGEKQVWEIWERDPNVQAFTDLLNRALDKPKEQEQELNVQGNVSFRWQNPSEKS